MTIEDHELLSALLDREPVDPDALMRLLDTEDGRALLVDFVRVRHTLHAAQPDVGPHHATRVPTEAGQPAASRDQRVVARPPAVRGLGRAAAALLLVAAGGVGGMWLADRRDDERAPEPSRVVRLTPVAEPGEGGVR